MQWSQKQVFEAERLYMRQMVSREQLARGGDVMGYLEDRMAHDLINYAHPLGIEMHKDDVGFRVHDEPLFDSALVTARWEPAHNRGMLIGGPADGTVIEMPAHAHRWQYRVVVRKGVEAWTPGTEYPQAVEIDTLDYRWSGWQEEQRLWTYEPAD